MAKYNDYDHFSLNEIWVKILMQMTLMIQITVICFQERFTQTPLL